MTDQMVSQRCRLQARRLAAQRPKTILQAQETLPYPSSLHRASSKTGRPLKDFPRNDSLRKDRYAINSHIHGYEKAEYVKDEGCSSTQVESSPAGQVMPNSEIDSSGLRCGNPKIDEKPRGNPGLNTPAPHHAKSEDLDSTFCEFTNKNDIGMCSTRHSCTTATHESDVMHAGSDWHTSLAIRPRRQAQEDRTNVGGR